MENFLATNLIALRNRLRLTQTKVAADVDLKRTTYMNYESGHTEPSIETALKLASYFGVSLEELMKNNLADVHLTAKSSEAENVHPSVHPSVHPMSKNDANHASETGVAFGNGRRQELAASSPAIVTVDTEGKAIAVMVSVEERDAYLAGFSNEDYISTLPTFRLPYKDDVAFRIFEVQGVSMLPTMQDEDLAISRWVGVSGLKDDRVHVLITRSNGILIKRVIYRQNEGKVICMSDHNERGLYPNIVLEVADILEAWYVVEKMTKHLPAPGEIYKRINDLEADMALIKQAIARGERLR